MRRLMIVVIVSLLAGGVGARAVAGPAPYAAVASGALEICPGNNKAGDFNRDGYADLAVGVPGEDGGAGAVNVIYGTVSGLSETDTPDQIWTQDSPDVEGVAEAADSFGAAVAAGDFNEDGYDDLAIGAPLEDFNVADSGRVHVIYGSASGLSATAIPDQVFNQGGMGLNGATDVGDEFGRSLTTGDIDGDGFTDLVIGVPGENGDAGAVQVVFGSTAGLSATISADQLWSQDMPDMDSSEEAGDRFGYSLAAGDLNLDGYTDVAIGVPMEDGQQINQGAVHVVYGSASGLSATTIPDQLWHQGSLDIDGALEAGDLFGWSVTIGDFNGDRWCDLAVGVPFEDVTTSTTTYVDAGAVNVIYSSRTITGLDAVTVPNQLIHRGTADVDGSLATSDWFGWAVAAGDFNADGASDLAVGAPGSTVSGNGFAGSVNVIYGQLNNNAGLSPTGVLPDKLFSQDTPEVKGLVEANDEFGYALTVGAFRSSLLGIPQMSLAIGVPGENSDAGAVAVLYPWSTSGLDPAGNDDQLWDQGVLEDTPESGDRMGSSLG